MATLVSLDFCEALEEQALSARREEYFQERYEERMILIRGEEHVQEEYEEQVLLHRRKEYFRKEYEEQVLLDQRLHECRLAQEQEQEWEAASWNSLRLSMSNCSSFLMSPRRYASRLTQEQEQEWNAASWNNSKFSTPHCSSFPMLPGLYPCVYGTSTAPPPNDPLPPPPPPPSPPPSTPSPRILTSSTALETLTSTLYTELALTWNYYEAMYARTAPLYTDDAARRCSTDMATMIQEYEISVANTYWAGRGSLMQKCLEWKHFIDGAKARATCGTNLPLEVLHPNKAVFAARRMIFEGELDKVLWVLRDESEEAGGYGRKEKFQRACERVDRALALKPRSWRLADEFDRLELYGEDRALVEGWRGTVMEEEDEADRNVTGELEAEAGNEELRRNEHADIEKDQAYEHGGAKDYNAAFGLGTSRTTFAGFLFQSPNQWKRRRCGGTEQLRRAQSPEDQP